MDSPRKNAFSLFCIVLLFACGSGCKPNDTKAVGEIADVLTKYEDHEMRALNVATLNLEGTPSVVASGQQAAVRTREVARSFKLQSSPWGIVGLQELYYRRVEEGPFGLSRVRLINKQFTCADGASNGDAAHCFAREVGTSTSVSNRALGLVSNDDFWEILAGSKVHDWIGEPRPTLIHRTVLGARFKNKRSGKIVPVYTVHISNAGNDDERFSEEVEDLVVKIRGWQVAGDLPPVLVGDFNCGTVKTVTIPVPIGGQGQTFEVPTGWGPGPRGALLAHFRKVSDVPSIDLLFVGRPESFPSSGEMWVAEAGSAHRIDAGYPTYTDHKATVVRLVSQPIPGPSDVNLVGPTFLDPTRHCP